MFMYTAAIPDLTEQPGYDILSSDIQVKLLTEDFGIFSR